MRAKTCGSLCIEGPDLVAAVGTWGFTGCSCMSWCVKLKYVVDGRGCKPKTKKKQVDLNRSGLEYVPGRKERDSSLGYTTHSRRQHLETMSQEIVCCLVRACRGKWLLCDLCKSKGFYQRNT